MINESGTLSQIMKLYEPKSCCICFDTKNGSVIIATLNLIGSLLNILFVVSGLLVFCIQGALEPLAQRYGLDHQQQENIPVYVGLADIAYNTLVGVCSSLLIHGIRKDRPGLMVPFLALQRFIIVICIILILTLAGLLIYIATVIETSSVTTGGFIMTIVLIIATIIKIYYYLVISAYHNKVKRAHSQDHSILYNEFNNKGSDYKVWISNIST